MAQTRWHKSESVYDEPRSFQNLHYGPKMAFNFKWDKRPTAKYLLNITKFDEKMVNN